jgi:hypothetical protein
LGNLSVVEFAWVVLLFDVIMKNVKKSWEKRKEEGK